MQCGIHSWVEVQREQQVTMLEKLLRPHDVQLVHGRFVLEVAAVGAPSRLPRTGQMSTLPLLWREATSQPWHPTRCNHLSTRQQRDETKRTSGRRDIFDVASLVRSEAEEGRVVTGSTLRSFVELHVNIPRSA